MPEQFISAGEDTVISPDTNYADPITFGYIDPLMSSTTLDTSANPFVDGGIDPLTGELSAPQYGVVGGIVGPAPPEGYDPSAFNSSSTTASTPGTSIFDSILKIGSLGLGITQTVTARGTTLNNPTLTAQQIANAKHPTSGAGTSSSLMWLAIAAFLGLVLWAEFTK